MTAIMDGYWSIPAYSIIYVFNSYFDQDFELWKIGYGVFDIQRAFGGIWTLLKRSLPQAITVSSPQPPILTRLYYEGRFICCAIVALYIISKLKSPKLTEIILIYSHLVQICYFGTQKMWSLRTVNDFLYADFSLNLYELSNTMNMSQSICIAKNWVRIVYLGSLPGTVSSF